MLHVSGCEAQGFDRFDLLVLQRWFSECIIFVAEASKYFFLLPFRRFGGALFFRIWFFRGVFFSLLFLAFLFEFGGSVGPGHDIGDADECFLFSEGVHFESGDDKLCLFEVALVEVVDDDIRVEQHLLEK